MNFRDFGLAEPLLRAVLQEGYTVATPIQAQAIPTVLEGHDVIGIAQTGTGKTAAFALPILNRLLNAAPAAKGAPRQIRVLVLASTRELAVQIHESFTNYGAFASVRVATIYGGVGQQPQVSALRKGVDVVVATPGRLLDLIKQGYVHLEGLNTLVLDEADRMLDMGFFPAIRRILEHVPRKRQTLMFSATMKPEIRDLANSILHNPVSISIVPKQKTTELVEQSVCFVPQKQKTRLLIELLIQHKPSRAIVFSRTKHGADRIVRNLVAAGFKSEAIHANKSQNKRQRILDEFKGQRPPILVATDIAARGIDVDLVSHVYLHDMPTEEETYVHRIGRSGRAGATGIAVSLCDSEERRMLKSIEKLIGMKIDVLEVPGFDMNQHVEDAPRSESGDSRRGQGRGDRPQRGGQRPGQHSGRLHPLQAARGERAFDGDREERPRNPAPARDDRPRSPRAGDRTEPPRRDLGREAERQRRPDPRRQDTPVANSGLRRQTSRPQESRPQESRSQETGRTQQSDRSSQGSRPQGSGRPQHPGRAPQSRPAQGRSGQDGPLAGRTQAARRPSAHDSRNDGLSFGDGVDVEERQSSARSERRPERRQRPAARTNQ
jgi:ATP-dependent RNA helicase RhlE